MLTINVGTGLIFSVGGSVAVSTIDGNTLAYIDDNAQIGTGISDQVDDIAITARAELDSKAKSYAVNAGIIAVNGSVANVTVKPVIRAYIGTADVVATNDITLTSQSLANAETDSLGVAAGGVGVGLSFSNATITPTIDTYIGSGNISAGGNIRLRSLHNFENDGITETAGKADAYATSPSGALISVNGAWAGAHSAAMLNTYTGSGATLNAGGNLTVESVTHNDAVAESLGVSGGAVAVGGSIAEAIASGTVSSHVDGNVTDAVDLTITATATNSADADTLAVAGGGVGVAGSDADAIISPVISAYLGGGDVDVSGNIQISSISWTDADADG